MDSISDLHKGLPATQEPAVPDINDTTTKEPMVGKENIAPKGSPDPDGKVAEVSVTGSSSTETATAESARSEATAAESEEANKAAGSATASPLQSPNLPSAATAAGSEATSTVPESKETSKPAGSATTSRSQSPGAGSGDDSSAASDSSSSSGLNPLAADFQPTTHAPTPPPPTASQLFELRAIEGKGLGLVAVAFIPQGTRVISESPLLRIDTNKVHLAWGPYCRLSNSQKAAYDALHYFKPEDVNFEQASRVYLIDNNDRNLDEDDIDDLIKEQGQVMGRFACNNFACGQGLGVFETTSRLNHSCVPNMHHSYNPNLKQQTVHALRDIQPGEELCTTYLGGPACYYVRAQRIELLRRTYGFTCKCPACLDVTGESDGRREVMATIAYGLQVFYQGGQAAQIPYVPTSPTQALQQSEDLIRLLLDEGLPSIELCKAYRMASTQALNIGDFDTAFAHAFREKDVERNCLGTDLDDLYSLQAATACWIGHIREAAQRAGVHVRDEYVDAKKKMTDKQKMAKKLKRQKRNKEKAVQKAAERDAIKQEKKKEQEAIRAEKLAKKAVEEAERKKAAEYEAAYPELKG